MRWKYPKHNDEKKVVKFAWYPIRGSDGYYYWFDAVIIHYKYHAYWSYYWGEWEIISILPHSK